MDVPKGFARKSKEIEEIVKKALEEYDALKKQKPVDLSKLNYEAIEIEYKDGTRDLIKADLLRYRNGWRDYPQVSLIEFFHKNLFTLYIMNEKDPEKIEKIIDKRFIKAIRTNHLSTEEFLL